MQCFDYIQLGRAFGEDYGKCLLRLDAAEVRFSRWGEAVGIAVTSHNKKPTVLSPHEFQLTQSLLQQIQDSFDDTEKISKRYRKHTEMEHPTSVVLINSVHRNPADAIADPFNALPIPITSHESVLLQHCKVGYLCFVALLLWSYIPPIHTEQLCFLYHSIAPQILDRN